MLNHGVKDFLGFHDNGRFDSPPEGWLIIGKVSDWTNWKSSEFMVGIKDPRMQQTDVKSKESQGTSNYG